MLHLFRFVVMVYAAVLDGYQTGAVAYRDLPLGVPLDFLGMAASADFCGPDWD